MSYDDYLASEMEDNYDDSRDYDYYELALERADAEYDAMVDEELGKGFIDEA